MLVLVSFVTPHYLTFVREYLTNIAYLLTVNRSLFFVTIYFHNIKELSLTDASHIKGCRSRAGVPLQHRKKNNNIFHFIYLFFVFYTSIVLKQNMQETCINKITMTKK